MKKKLILNCALPLLLARVLGLPLFAGDCYGGAAMNGKGDRFAAVFPDSSDSAAHVISFGSYQRSARKFDKSVRTRARCLLGVAKNGRTLAAGGLDGVYLYSFSGELLSSIPAAEPVAISRDFGRVVEDTGKGVFLSALTGNGASRKYGLCKTVLDADFSPDGGMLAYVCPMFNKAGIGVGDLLRVMDTRSGKVLREIKSAGGAAKDITSVKFSPDGRVLAYTAGTDIQFVSVSGWGSLKSVSAGDGLATYKVQFSADSAYFAAQHGTEVRIYGMKDNSLLKRARYDVGLMSLTRGVFAPDNSALVMGLNFSGSNTVKFMDLPMEKK